MREIMVDRSAERSSAFHPFFCTSIWAQLFENTTVPTERSTLRGTHTLGVPILGRSVPLPLLRGNVRNDRDGGVGKTPAPAWVEGGADVGSQPRSHSRAPRRA